MVRTNAKSSLIRRAVVSKWVNSRAADQTQLQQKWCHQWAEIGNSADHPNNMDTHAKHRFECCEWFQWKIFNRRAAGNTPRFTQDELTLWCTCRPVCVGGCVCVCVRGCFSAPRPVVHVPRYSPSTSWLTVIWDRTHHLNTDKLHRYKLCLQVLKKLHCYFNFYQSKLKINASIRDYMRICSSAVPCVHVC